MDLVRRSQTGIRIVADAHLEWLDLDGLPLCIRKNVSRLPVTPGNLFISEIGPANRIMLTPEELSRVLVISALKRTDPISKMFEIAFETFSKEWKDQLKIEWVEVTNEDQFIEAINNFTGSLAVCIHERSAIFGAPRFF